MFKHYNNKEIPLIRPFIKGVRGLFILTLFFISFNFTLAADNTTYTTLAPIQSGDNTFVGTTVNTDDLSKYLDGLFRLGVALAGALAVIMIVVGGVQYITSEAGGGKDEGKNRINAALLGLVVILGSYALLNTISPTLLSTKLTLENVSVAPIPVLKVDLTDPLYGSNGPTGGVAGAAANSGVGTGLTGSEFTEPFNTHATNAVNGSNLTSLNPSDGGAYLPNGGTTQDWVNFFAGITSKESNFNPNLTYTENFKDSQGNFVISTGLLQISQESARGYGFPGITTEQLKDPQTNLNVGVAIMQKWVAQDGCISCKDSAGNWRGGARYWSTLRN